MPDATAQLFPDLPKPVEDALRESISRFGVLVPVVKDQNGRLLDGRHRARLADDLGVDYRVDFVTVADDEEADEIQRTLNSDRRHLDADQRKEVAAALRSAGHSYRAIGGALGVDHKTAMADIEAATIGEDSPIGPERVQRTGGGTYPAKRPTITAAKNRREADRTQAALDQLDSDDLPTGKTLDTKRAERIAREKVADQLRQSPTAQITNVGEVEIRHGDLADSLEDLAGHVDAIITDPPYPAEFVPLFDTLGDVAAKLLKPNGVLVCMVGQSHLRDYLHHLDQHLDYRWVGAYITQGPRTRVHRARVGTGWKPILVYQQYHAAEVPFLMDDLFDSVADDKNHHHWGQSETGIADLVARFTSQGDLVVDPFLGGGTTAVVCRDLGRRFVGCDIDAAAVHTARGRVG